MVSWSSLEVAPRGAASSSRSTASINQEVTMAQTVLVVDDDPQIVRVVEINLTQEGYTVRTAADGEDALAAVAQERPDLIILDVMMPRMDGFETLKRLKADPALAEIPVIMLTARAQDEDVFEGYGTGAKWYLTKPFEPGELRHICRHVLPAD
jgi:two-component system alkaline phosphatase synthesis response regulator PhoP/two-component system response regulator VicR